MHEIEFAEGEILFRPGDPSAQAYLLQSGQVEILKGPLNQQVRLGLVGPGEVFGEMGLVEDRPRSRTARAVAAGRATVLARAEFEHMILHDPAQCLRYIRSLFERLRALAGQEETLDYLPALTTPDAEPPPVQLVLYPLTRKAAQTVPADGLLLTTFPFRIGRASEAREGDPLDLNDLWLLDQAPFHVSRNHLAIDRVADNRFVVRDRGSHLGLVVNDMPIGGRLPQREAQLEDGDNVLIVGGRSSPYQFRLRLDRATHS